MIKRYKNKYIGAKELAKDSQIGYYEALSHNFDIARKKYIKKFGKDRMFYRLFPERLYK